MKDRFEKDIKQIFNQHEEAVDQAALWAGIEDGISPKKKSRSFWFLAPIFLLALAAWGYVFWPVDNDLASSTTKVQSFSGNSDILKAEEIQPTEHSNAGSVKIETEFVLSSEVSSENLTLTDNILSTELQNIANSKTLSIGNDYQADNSIALVNRNIENLNQNTLNSFADRAVNQRNHIFQIQENKQGSADQQNSVSVSGAFETVTEKQQLAEINTAKIVFQDTYLELNAQLIDYVSESLPNSLKSNQIVKNKEPNLSMPKKKNSSNAQKLGVLLYGSLGFGVKDYKTPLDYGQNSEAKEQIQAGISLGVFSYKDFTFLTGLQYTMLTDEFTWSGAYNGSEVTTYLQEITYLENEDVIMSFVEEAVETTITREISVFPKRHILSIPLSVNYTFPIAKKSMSFFASYLLSNQMASREFLFNSKGAPGTYDIDGSWLNPNFELGLTYRYPLSDKLSLTFSPYYSFTSYKLQKFDLYSEHLNHHFGIKFGIGL
ncbi:hypothetical protein N9B82_03505 [Saprospiraceae bacterium]|nr:hypothetical protein [Saprospiraceae bacterium]